MEAQLPKLSVFVGQESMLCQYCIQIFKDGIQIRVSERNKEILAHCSQFISVKGKVML